MADVDRAIRLFCALGVATLDDLSAITSVHSSRSKITMLPKVILSLALCPLIGAQGLLGNNEYDYIVVGGGTGGNVMATRLAEKDFKVALIEAGGHYELQSFAAVPAADALPVGSSPSVKSAIDWGFITEAFPGANNRAIHFARGKTLGGSSALNFMIYQR